MKFRYNEFEKPSSKSYMAPQIREIEIKDISKTVENDKTVFDVYLEGANVLGEIGEEQLELFLINSYARRKSYSDVILRIHEGS